MENLRFMLSQYNPKVSLHLGHRFVIKPGGTKISSDQKEEGFMAGKIKIYFANEML